MNRSAEQQREALIKGHADGMYNAVMSWNPAFMTSALKWIEKERFVNKGMPINAVWNTMPAKPKRTKVQATTDRVNFSMMNLKDVAVSDILKYGKFAKFKNPEASESLKDEDSYKTFYADGTAMLTKLSQLGFTSWGQVYAAYDLKKFDNAFIEDLTLAVGGNISLTRVPQLKSKWWFKNRTERAAVLICFLIMHATTSQVVHYPLKAAWINNFFGSSAKDIFGESTWQAIVEKLIIQNEDIHSLFEKQKLTTMAKPMTRAFGTVTLNVNMPMTSSLNSIMGNQQGSSSSSVPIYGQPSSFQGNLGPTAPGYAVQQQTAPPTGSQKGQGAQTKKN